MTPRAGSDNQSSNIAGVTGQMDSVPVQRTATSVFSRIREDFSLAWRYQLLCVIGGAVWIPRVLRRLVYVAVGAQMSSAPGVKFVFAGRPKNLRVAAGVYMNRGVSIEAIAPVTIGRDCAFGMEAMIITSHHPIDTAGGWQMEAEGREVRIGDRVWVGARATILPGAVIESDVIIAAAAVVTGTCRSRGVYAGVPARRIRDYSV